MNQPMVAGGNAAFDQILSRLGVKSAKDLAPEQYRKAIDLFVLACTLSRVQASIEVNGEEQAAREIDILRMFAREARVRMKQNFRRIDNNDDEPLTALAEDAFEVERFRWDTI